MPLENWEYLPVVWGKLDYTVHTSASALRENEISFDYDCHNYRTIWEEWGLCGTQCTRNFLVSSEGALTAGINYYRANLGVPGARHELKYPMPVKIIWGCQDTAVTLTLLDDIIRAIPQVDVTRIEESSHWVQMDQPNKVCQSIRQFLLSTDYKASKWLCFITYTVRFL